MKNNLHPNWNQNCQVTCACGNVFTTGSMNSELKVDICSQCHPFFTGEQKFVDTQGRVERFIQKMKHAETTKSARKKSKKTIKPEDNKSYQQLLEEQKRVIKKADKKKSSS